MTADRLVERILNEYENTAGHRLKASERAASREYLVSDIPRESLSVDVTRKLAALTLYRSLQRLTDEKDDDWGTATNFKDIYDCRVCANAVAQMSVKGIMQPLSADEFGMTGILPDEEAENAVKRLFDGSKRLTNLLGFKPTAKQ